MTDQLELALSGDRIEASTPRSLRGGGGSSPTSPLQHITVEQRIHVQETGKAWQRLKREQSLDPMPPPASLALGTAWVHPIGAATARRFIARYEWLGTMPAIASHCFGIFFSGRCGGVVVYGSEYTENLGVWDRYGFTEKILLLARGACVHWSPPGTASRLIRYSMRLLPERYEVITATVDPMAGEIGTIYQACGFHYIGARGHTRAWWRIDGKVWSSRGLRALLGTQDPRVVFRRFPTARRIMPQAKGRYFAFRGLESARHLEAIRPLLQPYPKR